MSLEELADPRPVLAPGSETKCVCVSKSTKPISGSPAAQIIKLTEAHAQRGQAPRLWTGLHRRGHGFQQRILLHQPHCRYGIKPVSECGSRTPETVAVGGCWVSSIVALTCLIPVLLCCAPVSVWVLWRKPNAQSRGCATLRGYSSGICRMMCASKPGGNGESSVGKNE